MDETKPTNDRGPEGEAAREIVRSVFQPHQDGDHDLNCPLALQIELIDAITAALVAARVEERERCALVAEAHSGHGKWCGATLDDCQTATVKAIAVAIRALEQVKEEKQ